MCFPNFIFTAFVWVIIISFRSASADRDVLVLTSDAIGLLCLGDLKFSCKGGKYSFEGSFG